MSIYMSEGFFKNRKKRKEEKDKQKKEKQFRYEVDEAKYYINEMVKWWQNPKQLEDHNVVILILLKLYQIENSKIVHKAQQSKNIRKILLFSEFIDWACMDESEEKIKKFKNLSSKIINIKDSIYMIMVGDDTCIIGNNKELYQVQFDSIKDTTIEKFKCNPYEELDWTKEAIIQADKELGYYKLSYLEDSSVKKVPFPIK